MESATHNIENAPEKFALEKNVHGYHDLTSYHLATGHTVTVKARLPQSHNLKFSMIVTKLKNIDMPIRDT